MNHRSSASRRAAPRAGAAASHLAVVEAAIVTLLGFVLGSLLSVPVFLALGGDSGQQMNGPGAAAGAVTYLVLVISSSSGSRWHTGAGGA